MTVKRKILQELPIILLLLLPLAYLLLKWEDLPETVPLHWNGNMEADRWGPKTNLFIAPLLPLGMYLVFLISPFIDPKGKFLKHQKTSQRMKFYIVLLMSLISTYIIYTAGVRSLAGMNVLIVLVGALIAILGNYLPALKPNYFVGIRTPWTLEDETTWRKTHRLGGKLWLPAGIIIAFGAIVLPKEFLSMLVIGVLSIIAIVPIAYSFFVYRKIKDGPA